MAKNIHTKLSKFYFIPFFIYFINHSVALIKGGNDGFESDGNFVNQIMLSLAYITAFYILVRTNNIITIIKRSVPLILLLSILILSTLWSFFPVKVVISFIHNCGLALIAICMAITFLIDYVKAFKILLIFILIYIYLTIFITTIQPNVGVMSTDNIYSINVAGRWRGLTSHPNTLGVVCLFSTWISATVFFYIKSNRLIALMALIGTFYCLYKANSITSLSISLMLITGMKFIDIIRNSAQGIKHIKIFSMIFMLVIVLASLYVLYPDLFTQKSFFKIIGRDASLSGRTELWTLGLKAYAQKPFLGWSYDNLRSFLKIYSMGYGQLHNGYLDLLVRGGLVSMWIFIVFIVQIFMNIYILAKRKHQNYVIFMGLILATLVHNISEASILTNSKLVWLLMLISYFYTLIATDKTFSKLISKTGSKTVTNGAHYPFSLVRNN